jgi:hypothetical protein
LWIYIDIDGQAQYLHLHPHHHFGDGRQFTTKSGFTALIYVDLSLILRWQTKCKSLQAAHGELMKIQMIGGQSRLLNNNEHKLLLFITEWRDHSGPTHTTPDHKCLA